MTTAQALETTKPTAPYARLLTLDVLRGFALFGIFVVNVQFMSRPTSLALAAPELGSLDFTLWFLLKSLFMSKFVGVFSLLFGVGFALQWQRAKDASQRFSRMYVRRSLLLMGIGLAHGVFLFEGDILFPYSIAGLLLLALRGLSVRSLKVASVVCLLLAVATTGGFATIDWSEFDSPIAEAVVLHQEGPLSDLILNRAGTYLGWMVFSSLMGFNWRILCAFFLGAALLRSGFFSKAGKLQARNFALWTMAIGLLSEVGLTWFLYAHESAPLAPLAEGLHDFSSMILALGYVGVLRFLVQYGSSTFLARILEWISSAGRMALTNYLLQSILANVYFTFLGFAWYDTLDQAQLLGLVCATYAGQIALSVWWLKYFKSGPFEWAWRSATQGQVLPLLR